MTDTTCETCSKSSVCKFVDDFHQIETKAQGITQFSRLTPIEVCVGCKEHSAYHSTIVARSTAFDGIGG